MNKEDVFRMAREVGFSKDEIDNCQLMFEHFANLVCQLERERIAKKIEQLPFGDTAQSFASYVRNMKTCPPCHGNCNQGRNCPARNK